MGVPILNNLSVFIVICCQLFTINVVSGLPFASISSISSLRSSTETSNEKSTPASTTIISNDNLVTNDSSVMAESALTNFIIISPSEMSSQNVPVKNCVADFENINWVPLSTPSKLNLVASPIYKQPSAVEQSLPSLESRKVSSCFLSPSSNEAYLTESISAISPSFNIVPNLNINVESVKGPSRDTIFVSSQPQLLPYQAIEPLNLCTEKPNTDCVTQVNFYPSRFQQPLSNVASNCKTYFPVSTQSPSGILLPTAKPDSIVGYTPNSITGSNLDKTNDQLFVSSPNDLSTLTQEKPLNRQVISVQPNTDDRFNKNRESAQFFNIDKLQSLNRNSLAYRSNVNTRSNIRTDSLSKSLNSMSSNVFQSQDQVDSCPKSLVTSLNNVDSFTESRPSNTVLQNTNTIGDCNIKNNSNQVIFMPNLPKRISQCELKPSNTNSNGHKPLSNLNTDKNMNKVSLNTQIVQNVENNNNVRPVFVDKGDSKLVYNQPLSNIDNCNKNKSFQSFSSQTIANVESNEKPSYQSCQNLINVNNKNLVQPEIKTNIQFTNPNNDNQGCPQLKNIPISSGDTIYFSSNYFNKVQSNNNSILINSQSNQISQNNMQNSIKDNFNYVSTNTVKENNQGCPQLISLPLLNKRVILNKQNVNNQNCNSEVAQSVNKNNEMIYSNSNIQSPIVSTKNFNNDCNKNTVIDNNKNNPLTLSTKSNNKLVIRKNNTAEVSKILAQQNSYSNFPEAMSNSGLNQQRNNIVLSNNNIGTLQDSTKLMISQNPTIPTQSMNNPSYSNKLNCLASSPTYNDNLVATPNNIVQSANAVDSITSSQISPMPLNRLSSLDPVSSVIPTKIVSPQNTPTVSSFSPFGLISPAINTRNNDLPRLKYSNTITLPNNSLKSSESPVNPSICSVPLKDKLFSSNNILLTPTLSSTQSQFNNNEYVIVPPTSLLTLAPSLPTINLPKSYTNSAPQINQPVIYNQNCFPSNNLQALLTLLNNNINNNGAASTSAVINGISGSNFNPVQSLPQVSFVNSMPSPATAVPPIQVISSDNYVPPVSNLPFVFPSSPPSYTIIQPFATSPVTAYSSTVVPRNSIFEPRKIFSSLNRLASSLTQNIISQLISKAIPIAVNKLPPVNPTKTRLISNSDIDIPLRLDVAEPLAPYLPLGSASLCTTRLPVSNIPVACNEYLPPISNSQHEFSSDFEAYDSFMPGKSNYFPYMQQSSSIYKVKKASNEANQFERYTESIIL